MIYWFLQIELEMMDIMKFSIEYDDIDLLCNVVNSIGDIYLMFGEIKQAINTFNILVKYKILLSLNT